MRTSFKSLYFLQEDDGQQTHWEMVSAFRIWTCQERGKLIKDSQLSLCLHKLGRIGLAFGREIDGNLHIS